jgi:hypothetical protein
MTASSVSNYTTITTTTVPLVTRILQCRVPGLATRLADGFSPEIQVAKLGNLYLRTKAVGQSRARLRRLVGFVVVVVVVPRAKL